MPAIWLMPIAMPRWCSGKASVRMAVELAIRKAAPTPWKSRMTTSQMRGRGAGHPGDREQEREERVDDEAEVVHAHPSEHVAESPEADDQDRRHDHEAEDHPEQVERVARLQGG